MPLIWMLGLFRACQLNQAGHFPVDLPNDVVLLVKQFMHSDHLSQQPIAWVSRRRLLQQPTLAPDTCRVFRILGSRVKDEFLKTAAAIEEFPWLMRQASKHLQELIATWEKDPDPSTLPHIQFFASGSRQFCSVQAADFPEWHAFAPKAPTIVGVGSLLKRQPRNQGGEPKRRRLSQQTPPIAHAAMHAAAIPGQAVPHHVLPPLGCPKCRHSLKGCGRCRAKQQVTIAAGAAAVAAGAEPAVAGVVDAAPGAEAIGHDQEIPEEVAGIDIDENGPNSSDEELFYTRG